jgi:hypothetical protein
MIFIRFRDKYFFQFTSFSFFLEDLLSMKLNFIIVCIFYQYTLTVYTLINRIIF